MKPILLFVTCLFASVTLRAQQVNLKPGDEFAIQVHNVETEVDNKKVSADDAYTFQFKVQSKTADEYKLDCRLIKYKSVSNIGSYNLNSDSLRNIDLNNTGVFTPLILFRGSVTCVMNTDGKYLRVEGIDALIKKAAKDWHLKQEAVEYLTPNIEALFATNGTMFFELPKQKLGYLSEWKMDKANYQVTAIKGSLLDIAVKEGDNAQGKYVLNEVNGLVEDGHYNFLMTGTRVPTRLDHTRSIIYGKAQGSNLDTAWINMAIPLSYWSEAFADKTQKTDSAKIFDFMKKYDPIYKNDRYYVTHTLSITQRIESRYFDNAYERLLMKTPNYMIANEASHLHNKLQWADSFNADTAYDVITYFHKQSNFEDWLQESFAQTFLRDNDVVATQLIEKLNADKKLGIAAQINPMYLWAMAIKQPNNTKLLLKTYYQFMKMNDAYMHKGNGPRYALLTYKLLVNNHQQKEADKLLDRTTQILERFNKDTLNQNRKADKNILAYTYYLKYQLAAHTDSVAALRYLSKAAQYSPQNNNDMAHRSFYDRVFLKSKESYNEDFMKRLFESGNNEAALKIFADNITANPTQLDAMQQLYQKKFPDKSFKEFFENNVVNTWADAPAFELAEINGKKHALSDYKDKWLVIDFWGTWCGPCREELPQVDAFNKELIDGKHPGINLLGVSCFDAKSTLESFLTGNNIGITVAMSDNVIQKNYKINGYPSKILISPNGKMIDLVFGTDWQSVIKKFSEVYAAN